jgi:hypothetical protein
VPRFYVEARAYSTESALQVYQAATGRVVAIIKPPSGMHFDNQVVATARDHTFLTAASPGPGLGSPKRCVTQFYSFQLNDAGQPGPLIPLHITVPGEGAGAHQAPPGVAFAEQEQPGGQGDGRAAAGHGEPAPRRKRMLSDRSSTASGSPYDRIPAHAKSDLEKDPDRRRIRNLPFFARGGGRN